MNSLVLRLLQDRGTDNPEGGPWRLTARGPRSLTFVRSSAFRRWGLWPPRTPDRVNAELRTGMAQRNRCRGTSERQGWGGAPFGARSDTGGSPRGSRSESSVRSSAFRRWGLKSARAPDRVNAELRTGAAQRNHCRGSSEGPRAAARPFGAGPGRLTARVVLGVFRSEFRLQAVGPGVGAWRTA